LRSWVIKEAILKHFVERLRGVFRGPRPLMRMAAAAGITLAVIGLSILFSEWVFY
jgi:hypothetical protein